jgi:hypothetical protein
MESVGRAENPKVREQYCSHLDNRHCIEIAYCVVVVFKLGWILSMEEIITQGGSIQFNSIQLNRSLDSQPSAVSDQIGMIYRDFNLYMEISLEHTLTTHNKYPRSLSLTNNVQTRYFKKKKKRLKGACG